MLRPCIAAWVKKPREFRCARIDPGDIRALESVAVWAGEREIFLNVLPAMFLGPNVVDLKG